MGKPHILVVDDEKEITDLIEIYLSKEGYHVSKRYDALTLLDDLKNESVDLVLLDIMMPEIDGIQALEMIREVYNIPVIIVSAKTSDEDKILGLLSGADDYISKPFNAMELVARVKSQLRRAQIFNKPKRERSHIIESDGLFIDIKRKLVKVDNKIVSLTKKEYEILVLLANSPGRVYAIDEIFESVWKEKATNSNNIIMVHIRKLREKIERQPRNPRHIVTVWGVGYRFDL